MPAATALSQGSVIGVLRLEAGLVLHQPAIAIARIQAALAGD